ncbi:MAG TPA: hypothetical protein VIJ22_03500 [Polyangiaceae bacterium]
MLGLLFCAMGLVLGLLPFVLGIALGVIAIVLGIFGRQTGAGKAGLILGLLATVVTVLLILMFKNAPQTSKTPTVTSSPPAAPPATR